MRYNEHTFWCINCGKQALPLLRPNSKIRERFHRKRLYCYHCQNVINCIECKSDEEVQEFKALFEQGEFKQEAEESLEFNSKELI